MCPYRLLRQYNLIDTKDTDWKGYQTMKTWILAGIVLAMTTASTDADETTYAERLGWDKGDRVLIIHVDDAGMSHDSNVGVIESVEQGAANSFSVMMPCSWVPEIVNYIKKNPSADAGLHLTLTSEWNIYRWPPLTGKPATPGLVDREGCMWRTVAEVVVNATPDEVEREIRAQIDRARSMGFEPTHLDSHMGTLFATPEFMGRYIKVGIETGIPIMFPGGHNYFISRQNPGLMDQARAAGKQIWEAGLPVLDDLHNFSYEWRGQGKDKKRTRKGSVHNKTDEYIDAIRELQPGVTMMIMHCTRPSETFAHITDSGDTRLGDLEAMLDPAFQRALKEEGIILTTWRELKQRRDRAN